MNLSWHFASVLAHIMLLREILPTAAAERQDDFEEDDVGSQKRQTLDEMIKLMQAQTARMTKLEEELSEMRAENSKLQEEKINCILMQNNQSTLGKFGKELLREATKFAAGRMYSYAEPTLEDLWESSFDFMSTKDE